MYQALVFEMLVRLHSFMCDTLVQVQQLRHLSEWHTTRGAGSGRNYAAARGHGKQISKQAGPSV